MADKEAPRVLRAWGLSFVCYAAYYFGRKGFAVSKKALASEQGLSESALGVVDSAYLTAYALSQFVSGVLGDRLGARRLLGFGLLGSALACAAFGSASGALGFTLAYFANGAFQATGWPGTTRVMADFTTPKNRGSVMALWSTCYQVGGIVANLLCAYLLLRFGWRSAFWIPAALLGAMSLAVWFGLPDPKAESSMATTHAASPAALALESDRALIAQAQRRLLADRLLWSYSACYFFIKFIRYALLFWLPYYLATTLGYRADLAASVASAFEVGGVVGVIALGVLSDRTRRLSRAALSTLSLLGLALSLFLYTKVAGMGVGPNAVALACVGALLFGPDALLSGAAAQDAGGPRAAALATGMVNGVGSLGAILEGLLVPRISRNFGWEGLFPVLVLLALASAVSLGPALLRAKIPREE
ncbi:MAG: MFS transporter [Polyangiaceae bacterium]